MKKIYQKPETLTVKITSSNILSASNPQVGLDPDESVDAGSVESRRNNLWDEDEEEDF